MKKSVLEQALLQIGTLEEAVKQNAKGILASTMKQELNELLKEESSEEEEETEQLNPEVEDNTDVETDETDPMDSESGETEDNNETEEGDEEISPEEDGEDNLGLTDDESDFESDDTDNDFEDDEDDDMLDLTNSSDEEVLKVFKAMKPEDGIVVKKDENGVEFSDGENDYIIKLNESEYGFGDEPEYNPNVDTMPEDDDNDSEFEEILRASKRIPKRLRPSEREEEPEFDPLRDEPGLDSFDDEEPGTERFDDETFTSDEEDETIYEIELDGDDFGDEETAPEGEFTEAARTKWNPHGDKNGMNRAGLKSKKVFKAGSGQPVNEEVKTLKKTIEVLKEQNTEYKKALALFKEKLNEVAVFNANLAYSTRLFTENTTTKQEKLNILKRFDSVSTLNESKTLYSTIKGELESKKPVSESLTEKISTTPTPSSQGLLSESKAYVNPELARIKDLMKKVK